MGLSDWGWKGLKQRALEFPAGLLAAVSPLGRARLRYNDNTNELEVSYNGAPYVPIGGVSGAGNSVADLAALKAIDVSTLPDGAAVSVATLDAWWDLITTGASVSDTMEIVQSDTATTRQWQRRLGSWSPRWINQSAWHIDPVSGDDENDGNTLGTALETLDELSRRWGNGILNQSTTVTVAPGTISSDKYALVFRVRIGDYNTLTFQGTRTIVASGQFTAVTPETNTTPTRITDAGFGSFSPYVGDTQLVGTSGVIINRVAWVLNAPAVDQADISRFTANTGVTTEPAGNETFDLATVPVIKPYVMFEGIRTGDGSNGLVVNDLECEGGFYLGAWAGGFESKNFAQADFKFCLFDWRLQTRQSVRVIGCHFEQNLHVDGCTAYLQGGSIRQVNTRFFVDHGGEIQFQNDFVAYGGEFMIINGNIRINVSSQLGLFGAGGGIFVYDMGTLSIDSSTAASLLGSITGAANVLYVAAGGRVFYSNLSDLGTLAVAVGTGGAGVALVQNGAAGQTFASIPAGGAAITTEGIVIGPTAYSTWQRTL